MALSVAKKLELNEMHLPSDAEIRAQLERFMAISGFNEADMADAIGYSRAAINLFRLGRYAQHSKIAANSLALRAAIREYVEQHPTTSVEKSLDKLYRTENYKLLRRAFYQALDHGWAYCVDGAPGTQKTFILKQLMTELAIDDAGKNGNARRAFYVYCRQDIRPGDLMKRIAMSAGITPRGVIDQLIKKIHFTLSTRRVLLVLDEAQHLSTACVETLRELLDQPPYFGLLFAGSHDLENTFADLHMEQWRSRLRKVIHLPGITDREAHEIIQSEIGDRPTKAVEKLIGASRVKDYRRSNSTYISARSLFFTLEQIKRHNVQATV